MNTKSNNILNAYIVLRSSQDRKNKSYSNTGIIRALAEGERLKVSDIDKILYGAAIFTDKLNCEKKSQLLSAYNSGRMSLRELSEEYNISKNQIYKVLYEMQNQGSKINWRGAPKNFSKKTIETIADTTPAPPVKQENKPKEVKHSFLKAAGALAAGLVIGFGAYFTTLQHALGGFIDRSQKSYMSSVETEQKRIFPDFTLQNPISQEAYSPKREEHFIEVFRGGERSLEKVMAVPDGMVEAIRGGKVSFEPVERHLEPGTVEAIRGGKVSIESISQPGPGQVVEIRGGEVNIKTINIPPGKVRVIHGSESDEIVDYNL